MEKIAIIHGSYGKNAKEPISHCYIDGELQKRYEEFASKHKIIDISAIDHGRLIVRYEE